MEGFGTRRPDRFCDGSVGRQHGRLVMGKPGARLFSDFLVRAFPVGPSRSGTTPASAKNAVAEPHFRQIF